MQKENYGKGMLMIILSAFCFACMNVCVRLAGDVPSVQKSFFRNLVAAIFAGIILYKNHLQPKVKKEYWGTLILRCVFGTLGILCNFYAVDHLLVADASILNKLSPFFAIVFSFLLLKEKIKPVQAFCVMMAFVGCLFIAKPGFQNASLVPALIGVCGGMGAGIAYTMVRVLGTHGVKGPIIVFYFSSFSCVAVLPWIVMNFAPMTMGQVGTLLLAGLFAAGGQFSITAAYTYAPARKISIFDYSQIIFATVLGFALFGEIPDAYSFVGYGLIILASLCMFLYNRREAAA
ncbi:DMT family transporter [Ruminococcus sp. 5_1_39BFAA]|uniref:DMT family transporter n=1 Tax=Ruminococcus sp. 5_1_39BFAA TaxID=457412 RepID=UPI003564F808